MSLAAWLERNGHEVSIIDAAALREPHGKIAERAAAFRPDLIGVGGIITAYACLIGLTRELKRALPRVPIVLGGQVAVSNADLCFEHMAVDFVIHGYGEIALEKLARHLSGSLPVESIPGLSFRRGGRIVENPGREFFPRMDDIPFPAYHLVDMEHYATVNGHRFAKLQKYLDQTGKTVENHRYATVMGTLGCTDRCTFCIHEQEFVGFKAFSNEYLLGLMEFLHAKYDIHVFSIGEEMFLTTLRRAREFNRLMKERLPRVYWCASTRANHVTPDLIRELSDGNCFYVGWGFESGSQRMLDLMKKRISRRANIEAYRALDASSIVASTSLMVGNVGEDDASVRETVSAVREAGIFSATAFFASPYPGSRIWDWAVERGIIPDRHEYLMRASDHDAASRINCNLTPYPDFILRAWQQMIQWACRREERRKLFHLHIARSPVQKLKAWLKLWFGFYLIPAPLVGPLAGLYCILHGWRARFFPTERDRRYRHETEPDASLKVGRPRAGIPQVFRKGTPDAG
jgi:radical SAM superfamily enzyme YgiQ (UPF0313 family)